MIKEKIYLVLTPLRQTYPSNYEGTIIFLGNKDQEFLKEKNPKSNIIKLKSVWTNKEKLLTDNKYLFRLEKRFSNKFSETINNFFATNNTEKYWRIFLTPTIIELLTFAFERWLIIDKILKNYEIENCKFLNLKLSQYIKNDISFMHDIITNDDYFNQAFFQDILIFNNLNFKAVDFKLHKSEKIKKKPFQILKKIKVKNLIFLFKLIFNKINNFTKVFKMRGKEFNYISSGISNNQLKYKINNLFNQANYNLEIRNFQFKEKVNFELREKVIKKFKFNAENDFEKFIKFSIFKILPKCFLENYKKIQEKNYYYEKNYKFNLGFVNYDIIYSNNFNQIHWIGKNLMQGSKLFFLQNGGGQLTPQFSPTLNIIKDLKKVNLVFGLEDNKKEDIYGVGFNRYPKDKIIPKQDGDIIYTMFTPYGYSSNVISTIPIGSEWLDYIELHEKTLLMMPTEVQKKVLIRIKKRHPDGHPYKDYFNLTSRLLKKFKNIRHDDYTQPLRKKLENCKLLIATLDTTTILETLSLNFPTILILDLNKFKISQNYLPYYQKLNEVGILAQNSDEANNQIIKIINNINSWWHQKEVQNARENFCLKLAYHPDNQEDFFIQKISNLIK